MHGDVMVTMSGWARVVHTLHACLKMAFDYLEINKPRHDNIMQGMCLTVVRLQIVFANV